MPWGPCLPPVRALEPAPDGLGLDVQAANDSRPVLEASPYYLSGMVDSFEDLTRFPRFIPGVKRALTPFPSRHCPGASRHSPPQVARLLAHGW